MSGIDETRRALKAAEQFIVNGVELGYIQMPDKSTPDPAHDTLSLVRSALAALAPQQAALMPGVTKQELDALVARLTRRWEDSDEPAAKKINRLLRDCREAAAVISALATSEPAAWQRYSERTDSWSSVDADYAQTLAAGGEIVRPLYVLAHPQQAAPMPGVNMDRLYRAAKRLSDNIAEFGTVTDGEFINDIDAALSALATPEAGTSEREPTPLPLRNDAMGFVEFINSDVPYVARQVADRVDILHDVGTRSVIGYRVYDPAPAQAPVDGEAVLVPREFLEFVKHAPVSSGVCCCGGDMQGHPEAMACGHSPVDQWDYSLSCWVDQIAAAPTARKEQGE